LARQLRRASKSINHKDKRCNSHQLINLGGRITPRAYLTYCQSQLAVAILDREELLNQLGLAHSRCRHWEENTAEAQAELDAEESAQTLAEALGYGRTGSLVEFEGDIFDEVAAL
jgi:hypothetical protein